MEKIHTLKTILFLGLCSVLFAKNTHIIASNNVIVNTSINRSEVDTSVHRISINRDELLVGIISDAQFPEEDEKLSPGHFGVVMKGPYHFIRALKYFKNRQVDMMIMNGDMVNGGNVSAYHTYNLLLNDIFGKERKKMPPIIYPMGNHEYYCPNSEKTFKEQTGLQPDVHYVMNGIHFIGVSCSDALGGYDENRLRYLKRHLEIAVKENPRNPIMVISHMPFNIDEFYGGEYCAAQADEMYAILKKYPQVIYFCGHSHFPISSEKSFLQKDFTMVNTGGIGYFDLYWNLSSDGKTLDEHARNEYLNAQLIGISDQQDIYQRDAFNQGWEMKVNTKNGKVILQRMDYNLKRPFGEPIELVDLYKKNYTHTLKQLKSKAKIPMFPSNASIFVTQNTDGIVDICFNSCLSNILVQNYELSFVYPDKSQKKVRILSQGFYLGWDFPYNEHLRFYDCKQKGCYSLSIKAISSMGKESECIKTKFIIN